MNAEINGFFFFCAKTLLKQSESEDGDISVEYYHGIDKMAALKSYRVKENVHQHTCILEAFIFCHC